MEQIKAITPDDVKSKTPESFWSKVKFDDPEKCWEWQGSKTVAGYGVHYLTTTTRIYAHRFVLSIDGVNIIGKCSLHKCDNPKCCNPNHLFLGTKQDNTTDMLRKGRHRTNPNYGSKHHRSKLSETQVVEIKARVLLGETKASIARLFNVTKSQIYNIRMGKSWSHITI
jgi:hypothetical protein